MTHSHQHKHVSTIKEGMKVEFMLGSSGRTATGVIRRVVKPESSAERKSLHFIVELTQPDYEQHQSSASESIRHQIMQEDIIQVLE